MNIFLFQRVSQSEAIIFESNVSSTMFRNTRINRCLFMANYFKRLNHTFRKLSNLSVKGSVAITYPFVN